MSQKYEKLKTLLKELFQLDQQGEEGHGRHEPVQRGLGPRPLNIAGIVETEILA